jgi:RimJ/RimL family protein N-acetyltransferase
VSAGFLERFRADPPLAGDGVRLRPWRESDLGAVKAAARDARIPRGTTVPGKFTANGGLAFIHRQHARLDRGDGVALAIAEPDTDRAVGQLTLLLARQHGSATLGYWLVEAARGRGLATQAVTTATRWAVNEVGLSRIEAFVEPDNGPSMRVLERAGFMREGLLRSYLVLEQARSDAVVYSLLPDDITVVR